MRQYMHHSPHSTYHPHTQQKILTNSMPELSLTSSLELESNSRMHTTAAGKQLACPVQTCTLYCEPISDTQYVLSTSTYTSVTNSA